MIHRFFVLALLAAGTMRTEDTAAPLAFRDVAEAAGVRFRHDNAFTPEKYLIETMGSGAAWIDYDGDGWLDIYLANSSATQVYRPEKPLRGALYRNKRDGTFEDVTAQAGVAAEGVFAMGVAVADYDNDGDQDLYVAGWNRGILFRNEANGRFTDVTGQAGAGNPDRWASSAAWLDYDRDGRLDLAIANYVDWSPANNLYCGEPKPGYRSYCHPNKFKGQPPTLLRNRGDGTFEDVSMKSGVARKPANGLGIVAFDYNGDGWTDIFIANDSMENSLFRNTGKGTFEEVSVPAGVAFGENGQVEAGMGVDAADYDGDGLVDLFVTHLDFELNRLYRNSKSGVFEDATHTSGLGYQAFHLSGFGARFIDYDNDGWRDLFLANGHVLDNIHLFHPKTTFAEPKLVFRGNGRKFVNVTGQLGPDLARQRPSRAAAFADYDNDGDIDILVNNSGQPAELLRNEGGNRNAWLQVLLAGTKSSRDGVGAKITVRAGGRTWTDERKGGMSYQAAHDPRVHFGLGTAEQVDSVEVRWPSGIVDRISAFPARRVITVREGVGLVEDSAPKSVTRAAIDAEAEDKRGVALAEQGRIGDAVPHFRRALEARPDFVEARYHLALALDRTGETNEAIGHLRQVLEARPEFVPARYALAGACRRAGDLEGATAELRSVTARAPGFAEARLNLGLLLQTANRLDEAVEQLRAAVDLQPANPRAVLALGVALAEQQKPEESLAVLRKAVALEPANPEARYNLGLAAAEREGDEAETSLREALRLHPGHANARRALGVALMHRGRLDEANLELVKAVELAPLDAEAVNNLGLVLLRLKRNQEAADAFERALRINPKLIKAWNNLAQAAQRLGRQADAKRAAARAAELTAEDRARGRAMVLVQSGRQRLASGDTASAIEQFREASALSPDFDEAQVSLGTALRKSGAAKEAEAPLRRALEINPRNAAAYEELGLTLLALGDSRGTAAREQAARLAPCTFGNASR